MLETPVEGGKDVRQIGEEDLAQPAAAPCRVAGNVYVFLPHTMQDVCGPLFLASRATVGDVLRAVHAYFQERAEEDEVRWARARGVDLPDAQPVRRVHLLGKQVLWGGLQRGTTPAGTTGWFLRLNHL